MRGELLDISRSALRRLAASHRRANSICEGWPFQLHIQENWRIVRRAFIQAIFRVDQALFKMVRDTGFEPVTPTVSRYTGLLEAYSFSVGDSTWSHANPCRNEKYYSEMLRWLSVDTKALTGRRDRPA